jgi:hypothetical protein
MQLLDCIVDTYDDQIGWLMVAMRNNFSGRDIILDQTYELFHCYRHIIDPRRQPLNSLHEMCLCGYIHDPEVIKLHVSPGMIRKLRLL